MTYKILSVSQIQDTITTTVEITLSTGVETIDIIHFRPSSVEEINQNVQNRLLSEQSKIDAIKTVSNLITTIPVGETVTV